MDFTYGDELTDFKVEEISNAYLDALDEYIGDDILIPGIDALHVLVKVNNHKRGAYGNPRGEKKSNTILYTSIYKLKFLDGRIYEFAVNFFSGNLSMQADSSGWYTGLIYEVIYIQFYPSIAVMK